MRSTSWGTILLPFLALAAAALADQALAIPVVMTKYFGPARTQPTELPEAESSAISDGALKGNICSMPRKDTAMSAKVLFRMVTSTMSAMAMLGTGTLPEEIWSLNGRNAMTGWGRLGNLYKY
ncbi:hypothetical protein EX30DRAFT_351946 [Ascodesmis nigricans]|uniref:Uncharacterized protein n=1 Tax=Ascodesmis nigricans TaxID=341454 RepID=A0A4S2MR63_9PEZI|nr:hypothetical protein EX30DRAFT_351946 [Ascodesmis nigricans]